MTDTEHKVFEVWWKETGQFICAGGQPDHKEVIRLAFMAGWELWPKLLTTKPQ